MPTVSDRIAQMVAKLYFEPQVDQYFHPDSYGYRPGKSAIEAIEAARQRCWRFDWALDLDIKAFFDEIDHQLLMRAVRKHTDCRWLLLYIERWLKAPAQLEDGTLVSRDKGSPQGSVISPLLANLFLHYAFDEWMRRNFSSIPFERYADDILVHCKSERQARGSNLPLRDGCKTAGYSYILRRQRLSIVRIRAEGATIPTRNLIFWDIHFIPDCQRVEWESFS